MIQEYFTRSKNTQNTRNDWIVDKFKGEDVFVVAGGSSLMDFNFEKLKGKRTIAVNYSYFYVPDCDIMVFIDQTFLNVLQVTDKQISDIKCPIITGPNPTIEDSENVFRVQYSNIPSRVPYRMFGSQSSSLIAINTALLSGAKNIYLLGMDCHVTKTPHFYSNDLDVVDRADREGYSNMMPAFEKYGMYKNIFNCSDSSRLTCFQRKSIKEVI